MPPFPLSKQRRNTSVDPRPSAGGVEGSCEGLLRVWSVAAGVGGEGEVEVKEPALDLGMA